METLFESIKESKASDVLDGLNADMTSMATDALEEAKAKAFEGFGLALVEKEDDEDKEEKESDDAEDDKDDEDEKESEDDE